MSRSELVKVIFGHSCYRCYQPVEIIWLQKYLSKATSSFPVVYEVLVRIRFYPSEKSIKHLQTTEIIHKRSRITLGSPVFNPSWKKPKTNKSKIFSFSIPYLTFRH